ncbi:MAG: hypothetical protein P8Z38_02225 [Robiginitalea sp.]
MSIRTLGLIVSLLVFCAASYLLVTASPLLLQTVSGSNGMPWGTLIAWFGLLSLPILVYFLFPGLMNATTPVQRILKGLWLLSLILALVWPLASFYLAGNWSYSFKSQEEFRGSARASVYYWNLVKITALLPLVVFFGFLLDRFLGRGAMD